MVSFGDAVSTVRRVAEHTTDVRWNLQSLHDKGKAGRCTVQVTFSKTLSDGSILSRTKTYTWTDVESMGLKMWFYEVDDLWVALRDDAKKANALASAPSELAR